MCPPRINIFDGDSTRRELVCAFNGYGFSSTWRSLDNKQLPGADSRTRRVKLSADFAIETTTFSSPPQSISTTFSSSLRLPASDEVLINKVGVPFFIGSVAHGLTLSRTNRQGQNNYHASESLSERCLDESGNVLDPLSGPVLDGPRCNLFAGVHSGILPEFRLQRARAGKLMMAEITGGDVNGDSIAGMRKLPNLFLVQIDVARPQ
jgi:hypothetical protein